MTRRKTRALEVPPVVPYKALENFPKALCETTGGTYSARVFRPVMISLVRSVSVDNACNHRGQTSRPVVGTEIQEGCSFEGSLLHNYYLSRSVHCHGVPFAFCPCHGVT